MSRRRLNRKPNRFRRTSKPRGVLSKLRGGDRAVDLQKISEFSIEFTKLRDESNIIGIKAQIAQILKENSSADTDTLYTEYTIALGDLITKSLNLATTKYPNDADVLQLKDQVAVLMSVAIPANAKYYDLRDVYETIADFFVKKSMKLMSPSE